jgi:hypothetical protein
VTRRSQGRNLLWQTVQQQQERRLIGIGKVQGKDTVRDHLGVRVSSLVYLYYYTILIWVLNQQTQADIQPRNERKRPILTSAFTNEKLDALTASLKHNCNCAIKAIIRQKVVTDVTDVLDVSSANQTIRGLDAGRRPHSSKRRSYKSKHEREVREIMYLHYCQPSNENEIRRHGLNGSNHREIHKDLKELGEKGLIGIVHHKLYELTVDGEEMALDILNQSKSTLEDLDLPTTFEFGGQGKN